MTSNVSLSGLKGRLFFQIVFAITLGVVLLSAISLLLTFRNFAQLESNITDTLSAGRSRVDAILGQNQQQLHVSLDKVQHNAAAALTDYLSASLKAETAVVEKTLHAAMMQGAESLATMLAEFSHDAIIGRNYSLLVKFAKTASAQDSVVFAVYKKPDGSPYTRYINRQDANVARLIAQGSGATGFDKLLAAAATDPTIQLITREIRFEGQLLGHVEVGVTTAGADAALSAMQTRMAQLIENSHRKVSEILQQEAAVLSGNLDANFHAVSDQLGKAGESTVGAVQDTADSLLLWQVGFASLAGLIILVALCAFFLLRVIHPIRGLTLTMEDIASGEGDLTRRLPENEKDEVGQLGVAFNHFVGKIQSTIAQAGTSTDRLAAAAEQLSRVAHENSAGVNAQRSETEQVAMAVTRMSATVREMAENAQSAAQAVNEANTEAGSGKQVVSDTVSVINRLSGEVGQAAQVINRLEEDSAAIGTVLDVIRNIADQTNLLALNAAIEAARAGEQGRGFAVVAEEVRSLASRTQESTQEIQSMIERVQNGTREAVNVMTSGVTTTQDTVEKAAKAGESLDNIVTTISSIAQMNNQIVNAAGEQTVVAEDIDRSVLHISELSSNAAQGTQQIAQASGELAALGDELRRLVGHFRV
jgi:methyl-accepting chemotaxis protein